MAPPKATTLVALAMMRDMTGYGIIDAMLEVHAYANMADPFGNGFDLIEFSGPGYDSVSR
jgi:hypothetical protein